jgi:uncharacterized membrane protein
VSRYRYPRLSDPTLDVLLLVVATALAVIGAAFAPPFWRCLLVVLVVVFVAGTALQIKRRYAKQAMSPMAESRRERSERYALITAHFNVKLYTVSCKYCDWSTTDYAHRLVTAPKHLRDKHPEHDTRIPAWLRRRGTAWLGRLVTVS